MADCQKIIDRPPKNTARGELEASVKFHRRPKLEFHGGDISSDGGLLPYRALDRALESTEPGAEVLSETRRGKKTRHLLVGLLRQSVFSRCAGYYDLNDAQRLSDDPVMRAIVDRIAVCPGLGHPGSRDRDPCLLRCRSPA